MKSYTDIEQSKKLVNILPIESADMCYGINDGTLEYDNLPWLIPYHKYTAKEFYIPCWSLAALLNAMPSEVVDNHFLTLHKEGKEYCCCYENYNGHSIKGCFSDNPIDACVAMIEKLNELKML